MWDVKRGKSVFVFGKSKANKTSVRSEECSKRSGRKRRRKAGRPRKRKPYTIRKQKLKMEEIKHAQRRSDNWRRLRRSDTWRRLRLYT